MAESTDPAGTRRRTEPDTPRPRRVDPVEGAEATPLLPHERDQSPHAGQSGSRRKVTRQALEDTERGLRDTDRRSAYGLADEVPPGDPGKG